MERIPERRIKTETEKQQKKVESFERYIRGNLPLEWFLACQRISYAATATGLLLWYLSGVKKSKTVKVSQTHLDKFFTSKSTFKRTISQLEKAGLVSVEREPGKAMLVTIQGVKDGNK